MNTPEFEEVFAELAQMKRLLNEVHAGTTKEILETEKKYSSCTSRQATHKGECTASWARSKTARKLPGQVHNQVATRVDSLSVPTSTTVPVQPKGFTFGSKPIKSMAVESSNATTPGPSTYNIDVGFNSTKKRVKGCIVNKSERFPVDVKSTKKVQPSAGEHMMKPRDNKGVNNVAKSENERDEMDTGSDNSDNDNIENEKHAQVRDFAPYSDMNSCAKVYSFSKAVRGNTSKQSIEGDLKSALNVAAADKWVKPRPVGVAVMRPPSLLRRAPGAKQRVDSIVMESTPSIITAHEALVIVDATAKDENHEQVTNNELVDVVGGHSDVLQQDLGTQKIDNSDNGSIESTKIKHPGTSLQPSKVAPAACDEPLTILAYRHKSPSVIMRPPTAKTEKQRLYHLQQQKAAPGPGEYDIMPAADVVGRPARRAQSASRGTVGGHSNVLEKPGVSGSVAAGAAAGTAVVPFVPLVGKLYHESSRPSSAAAAKLATKAAPGPGPGYYSVDKTDPLVRQSATSFTFCPPESKPTPQLEKKRYWEEKARDARDVHDFMTSTDDSVLYKRVAVAHIERPKSAHAEGQRAIELRDVNAARRLSEEPAVAYAINYSAVERQPQVRVTMAKEVESRKSLQEKLSSKAGVMKVKADKINAEKARETFYGPQLPVPWVQEDVAYGGGGGGSGGGGGGVNRDDGDGPESPTREVMRLMKARQASGGFDTFQLARGDAGMSANATAGPNSDTATATAFLRSSYAGGSTGKPAPIMRDPRPHEDPNYVDPAVRDIVNAHKNADFIGPQLPTDWVAESEGRYSKHKTPALRMDLNAGRDIVKVFTKGVVKVTEFVDPKIRKTDQIGPGHYDVEAGRGLGDDAKGLVAFKHITARDEAIGPNGEKPLGAQVDVGDLADDDLYRAGRLDIDYGIAKDAAIGYRAWDTDTNDASNNGLPRQGPGFVLYRQDRHDDGEFETKVGKDKILLLRDGEVKVPDILNLGDKVVANYRGRGKWYTGTIDRDYDDGTYDISFYEEQPAENTDRLGGEWHEAHGLAAEMEKKHFVKMNKMQSRTHPEEEDILMSEVGQRHELELEVKDWKPGMPRSIFHVQFPDKQELAANPQKYPRFAPAKKPEKIHKSTKSQLQKKKAKKHDNTGDEGEYGAGMDQGDDEEDKRNENVGDGEGEDEQGSDGDGGETPRVEQMPLSPKFTHTKPRSVFLTHLSRGGPRDEKAINDLVAKDLGIVNPEDAVALSKQRAEAKQQGMDYMTLIHSTPAGGAAVDMSKAKKERTVNLPLPPREGPSPYNVMDKEGFGMKKSGLVDMSKRAGRNSVGLVGEELDPLLKKEQLDIDVDGAVARRASIASAVPMSRQNTPRLDADPGRSSRRGSKASISSKNSKNSSRHDSHADEANDDFDEAGETRRDDHRNSRRRAARSSSKASDLSTCSSPAAPAPTPPNITAPALGAHRPPTEAFSVDEEEGESSELSALNKLDRLEAKLAALETRMKNSSIS